LKEDEEERKKKKKFFTPLPFLIGMKREMCEKRKGAGGPFQENKKAIDFLFSLLFLNDQERERER